MVIFYAREVWSTEGDRCMLSTVPNKINCRSMFINQQMVSRKDKRKEVRLNFHLFGKHIQVDQHVYQPMIHKNNIVYSSGIFVG